jgi:hypothetical protein
MRHQLFLAGALLAGCTTPDAAVRPAGAPIMSVAPTPQRIVDGLAGTWDNRAQYDAAPATLKVPPSVDGDWLDRQHARFVRVDAPAIGDAVLYLEWRSGGPDGPVSRQRIWSFRADADGTPRMDFYAFVDGAPWVDKADDPDAFRSLDTAALRGYGPQCALRWAPHEGGWQGVITADACTLTAASGRRMGITATVTLAADGGLLYQESGRLESGAWAFRVPPSGPYRFERLD